MNGTAAHFVLNDKQEASVECGVDNVTNTRSVIPP